MEFVLKRKYKTFWRQTWASTRLSNVHNNQQQSWLSTNSQKSERKNEEEIKKTDKQSMEFFSKS